MLGSMTSQFGQTRSEQGPSLLRSGSYRLRVRRRAGLSCGSMFLCACPCWARIPSWSAGEEGVGYDASACSATGRCPASCSLFGAGAVHRLDGKAHQTARAHSRTSRTRTSAWPRCTSPSSPELEDLVARLEGRRRRRRPPRSPSAAQRFRWAGRGACRR
ncbi:hypothetical protein QJS66_12530 [Kocuria rhizophila]|nr:hypothetical protein QJS66_12530 [Kocuria rhizophila]